MSSLVSIRGKYYLQFCDQNREPRRRTINLKTTNKTEAERLRVVYEHKVSEGSFDPWLDSEPKKSPPRKRYARLGEAVNEFIRERKHIKASSTKFYEHRLRPFERFIGSETQVRNITPSQITGYLESTRTGDVTKRTYLGALSAFFAYLIETDAVDDNPCKRVKLRKAPTRIPKALSEEEVGQICDAIVAHQNVESRRADFLWLIPLIRTTIYTGLRRSEIANLRWKDVDLANGVLYVRNTDTFRTKDSEDRVVPIAPPALPYFEHLATASEGPHDYVYKSNGRQIHVESLTWRFAFFCKLAGVDACVHALRHTALSWLAMRGIPLEALRQFAGHASASMTLRYMSCQAGGFRDVFRMAFDRDRPVP
jgi:integrase